MANRLWVPDIMMARMDPTAFSGPSSGHGRQSEDLNISPQENSVHNGYKKRRLGDDGDHNAAKADEEHPGEGTAVVIPRPRGRPKGSRNKPKVSLSGIQIREIPNQLKSYVFEIPNGADVTETLETFAHRRQLGLFILSGNGMVSNVTLRRPATPAGMVIYIGPLQILSMTGAFPYSSESCEEATGITVSLADVQGVIVAGSVVGRLVAFGRVFVVAGTVADIHTERPNVDQPVEVQSAGLFQSSDLTETEKHINMVSSIGSLSANCLVRPPPEHTPDRMLNGVYDLN